VASESAAKLLAKGLRSCLPEAGKRERTFNKGERKRNQRHQNKGTKETINQGRHTGLGLSAAESFGGVGLRTFRITLRLGIVFVIVT
jgi:hypothetical protein